MFEVDIADEFAFGGAVDTDIDHDGAFAYVVGGDELLPADGGYDDVCHLGMGGEVFCFLITYGDGGAAVDEECGEWLPYGVRPADDDGVCAHEWYVVGVEHADHPCGCSGGDAVGESHEDLALVQRVEAVGVLTWGDGGDDGCGIDVGRGGLLDEAGIDGIVGIELVELVE